MTAAAEDKNLKRFEAADLNHHLECLAKEEIADQYTRLVAPKHSGGEPSATQFTLVNDIVVQQRCRMHKLDRGGELDMAVAAVAGEPCQSEREHGPQPLTAGVYEMVCDLRNHRHFGAGARKNDAIDALHIGRDKVDQRVDGRSTRSFKRNDNGHRSPLYARRVSIETLW